MSLNKENEIVIFENHVSVQRNLLTLHKQMNNITKNC